MEEVEGVEVLVSPVKLFIVFLVVLQESWCTHSCDRNTKAMLFVMQN